MKYVRKPIRYTNLEHIRKSLCSGLHLCNLIIRSKKPVPFTRISVKVAEYIWIEYIIISLILIIYCEISRLELGRYYRKFQMEKHSDICLFNLSEVAVG